MGLAIFDLDNTLIAGDSDYLWGQFLVRKGAVDGEFYDRENKRYYEDYKAGNLDIFAFLAFSLKPLSSHPLDTLLAWRKEFMETEIEKIVLPKALALIEQHRRSQDTLLIITATNEFITAPIADRLGIPNLLATIPEFIDNQYTGGVSGVPCYKDGKVKRLNQWLAKQPFSLQASWFYSDSHNDIPLLELVTHPVVVDGDPQLSQLAKENNWQHISLR